MSDRQTNDESAAGGARPDGASNMDVQATPPQTPTGATSPPPPLPTEPDGYQTLTPTVMRQVKKRAGTDVPLLPSAGIALGLTVTIMAWMLVLPECYLRSLMLDRGSVQYVLVFLASWSICVVVWKRLKLRRQAAAFALDLLPESVDRHITTENVERFRLHVMGHARKRPNSILVQRIWHALDHFRRSTSRAEVADFLSEQSQLDAAATHSSFSLLKVFLWAIPIFGFIGTVLGIGEAVGGFSSVLSAADDLGQIKMTLSKVTVGLAVAFDTTLLALVLSVLIAFPASMVQRREERLLAQVEDWCNEHLVRRLVEPRAAAADQFHPEWVESVRLALIAAGPEMGRAAASAFTAETTAAWEQSCKEVTESLTAALEAPVTGITALTEEVRTLQADLAEVATKTHQAVETLGRSGEALAGVPDRIEEVMERMLHNQEERAKQQQAALDEFAKRLTEDLRGVGLTDAAQRLGEALKSHEGTWQETAAALKTTMDAYRRHLDDAGTSVRDVTQAQTHLAAMLKAQASSHGIRTSLERLHGELSRYMTLMDGDGESDESPLSGDSVQ
ncbi:MAG: MotA/TolQ/ExbB proton channel family protein [Planctomycetota bacterium]